MVRAFWKFSKWSLYLTNMSIAFFASLSPDLAIFSIRWIFLSIISRSFTCNSRSMISISLTGFTDPSICGRFSSSKHRKTWTIASQRWMSSRNLFPIPSPWLEPFANPGISTISTLAGVTLTGFTSLAISSSLLSGTSTTPRLDLDALKAKLLVSAFVFDMQLKIVVLPILVIPIIPHFSAIFYIVKS